MGGATDLFQNQYPPELRGWSFGLKDTSRNLDV